MVRAETVNRIIGFHGDGLPVLSLYGRIPPGASTRAISDQWTEAGWRLVTEDKPD